MEQANLKAQMRDIAVGSLEKVFAMVDNPEHSAGIKRAAFESALDGIRTGQMTYKDDALLPAIEAEMSQRLQKFQGLSKEEEVALFALTDEQRKQLAENDKRLKNEYLVQPPQIGHGAVKMHYKYKHYMKMVTEATK